MEFITIPYSLGGASFWCLNIKIREIWVPKVMVSLHGLEGLGFRVWDLGPGA